jgi:hypothetical protein
MGEYILYVIFVFVPIGGAMAYLLYKDGLPRKYINIILILSLLIILSFPISMERLGGLASLIIYVLLVAFISWYILNGRAGDLAMLISRLSEGEQLFNNLKKNDSSVVPDVNKISVDDEPRLTEAIEEMPEKEETPEEKIELEISPEEKKEEISVPEADISTDEGLEPDPSLIDLPVAASDEEDEELESDETGTSIEAEEKAVETQIVTDVDVTPEADFTPEAILEEKETEEYLPEETTSLEDTVLQPDIDVQAEPSIQETVEPVFVDSDSDEAEEIEEVEESEMSEKQKEQADITAVSQVQLLELIDNGFACRDSNREEAARCFEAAWQITSAYELKHLLTLELFEIYKECGWYSKAREILDSFIVLPGHKSDIINEINYQIDYISLLTAELERLGISDLPISRVPRWVRLKVDGEMNPPGV